MTTLRVDVDDAGTPVDTRQRLLDVAMALISQNGFAGTSLQMIADELGFTKAAIYYHFRTRDDLLAALMEPILAQSRQVIAQAESQRTPRAQMEAMVCGYAEIVAQNRSMASVLVFDASVRHILQTHEEWGDIIGRQLALLMQLDSDTAGFIKTTALFSGLAGAATAAPTDMDDETLTEELASVGRRLMGLRQPRRLSEAKALDSEPTREQFGAAPWRWKDRLTEV